MLHTLNSALSQSHTLQDAVTSELVHDERSIDVTRLLDLVGDDTTHEVRVSRVQVGHQLQQRFLLRERRFKGQSEGESHSSWSSTSTEIPVTGAKEDVTYSRTLVQRTKNQDVSTRAFAHPFAHSLASVTHLLAPHCSFCLRTPLCSFVCSIPPLLSHAKINNGLSHHKAVLNYSVHLRRKTEHYKP